MAEAKGGTIGVTVNFDWTGFEFDEFTVIEQAFPPDVKLRRWWLCEYDSGYQCLRTTAALKRLRDIGYEKRLTLTKDKPVPARSKRSPALFPEKFSDYR
jgi:hypothetical protein